MSEAAAGGFKPILFAATYAGAINIVQQDQPDIILLDINLPDRNGIDLLEFVHANYQQIIVFMVTNQASDHYRTVCAQLGAQRFFDKTTEFENLAEAVSA
jgi:DNA-binding NarL/FixJ family response regulator